MIEVSVVQMISCTCQLILAICMLMKKKNDNKKKKLILKINKNSFSLKQADWIQAMEYREEEMVSS